ncbi:unnamed protein product [Strongylus vulgaris]|uniref:Uncharacterized protein n=1 Tax=Strongylus vulgaris TaxID=40348 RepID=A0A3P7LDR2_STRVU|nr:unnamed protein product [Strongylus vulgaris]
MAASDAIDVKVVVVGDSSVGKSAILKRFFDDKFEDSLTFTIGIDFRHIIQRLEDGTVSLRVTLVFVQDFNLLCLSTDSFKR